MAKAVTTKGYGTTWERSTNGTTYAALAQTKNPKFPAPSRDTIDTTHDQSPDNYTEEQPGMKTGNTMQVEMFYKTAEYTMLLQDFEDGTELFGRMTLPNGDKVAFKYFVTTPPAHEAETRNGVYNGSMTIQIVGKVTHTVAA